MWDRYRRIVIGGIAALVAGFLLLQLLPVDNPGNPPIRREPAWDSPQTQELARRVCYDCHSNETVWPWYARVAPMSMLLVRDVREGREVLNFSEWPGDEGETETEEIVEVIAKGEMPPSYYLILHPEARLTEAETGQLINGLIASLEIGE
ncbi:MAG: heme-binding domain-containing protein [Chloroflexi bacterium]|nr:heme-binding domain-containing protein [Chloroflexota bacterium]MCI0575622.1 heme-binding domain-containing protein [Chloroflexota bacterium]MCI0648626.1 heme-binding domain-containing protein [Chloroflexota bacterium]MCI0728157.1 heme-binding domain-containing protein [Chloroflexota bacterium]